MCSDIQRSEANDEWEIKLRVDFVTVLAIHGPLMELLAPECVAALDKLVDDRAAEMRGAQLVHWFDQNKPIDIGTNPEDIERIAIRLAELSDKMMASLR